MNFRKTDFGRCTRIDKHASEQQPGRHLKQLNQLLQLLTNNVRCVILTPHHLLQLQQTVVIRARQQHEGISRIVCQHCAAAGIGIGVCDTAAPLSTKSGSRRCTNTSGCARCRAQSHGLERTKSKCIERSASTGNYCQLGPGSASVAAVAMKARTALE